MADNGTSVSDQVAAIIAAAEQTAAELRDEAEARLRARIDEANRAAENRVKAAEDEAAEIVRAAHEDASRIGRDAVARAQSEADRIRMQAEEIKTTATGEALAVVARAQENADKVLSDANERARVMLRDARVIAGDIRTDGLTVVQNVRELGDSLRSNAERLLRDIQGVHATYLKAIDKVDPERSSMPRGSGSRGAAFGGGSGSGGPGPGAGREIADDDLDVPEFIPRG